MTATEGKRKIPHSMFSGPLRKHGIAPSTTNMQTHKKDDAATIKGMGDVRKGTVYNGKREEPAPS